MQLKNNIEKEKIMWQTLQFILDLSFITITDRLLLERNKSFEKAVFYTLLKNYVNLVYLKLKYSCMTLANISEEFILQKSFNLSNIF